MGRLAALAAVLAAGFLLFYSGARTPAPAPADAPAGAFSAGRAMGDIQAMASVPHPVGSPQNAKVRDRLVARMTALGLSPQVQRAFSQGYEPRGDTVFGAAAEVENVVGVLPGRDRSAPALALMAHYDSVQGSPGAADDMAGVASALEVMRAIETGGTPARDVVLVITDGEEAGLLGAQAFFASNPLARRVGFVLNMEARGGGGRAAMFETGEANGAAVRLYARVAPRPSANSLSVFVYKLLPNDTDYTVAKRYRVAGLNFAFIGREFDYHSPSSTPAVLDQGSVQHMGDQVLAVARAMAFAPRLPTPAPDAVYGTLPGGLAMLAYAPAMGWVLILAIAGLIGVAAWRARAGFGEPIGWLAVFQGFFVTFLILAASALALHLTRRATGFAVGWYEGRGLLARFAPFEVAMALSAAGSALLVAAGVSQGRSRAAAAVVAVVAGLACSAFGGFDLAGLVEGGVAAVLALILLGRPAPLAATWLGLLLAALLAAVALQAAAPTTALIVAWPLAAGALGAAILALGKARSPVARVVAAVVGVLSVAWCGDLFHTLLQGLDVPEIPMVPLWLAALALWPLLWPESRPGSAPAGPGAILAALGLALALGLHFTSPWSPRHPQALEPYFVIDHDKARAWRASEFAPGPWAQRVLSEGGGSIARLNMPAFRGPVWAAPAGAAPATAAPVSVTEARDGGLDVAVQPSTGGRLLLTLKADAPVGSVLVNGQPAPILKRPGQVARLEWSGPLPGATISIKAADHGTLHLEYARFVPGWPLAARPLPPLPANAMAWDMAASTVSVGRIDSHW